MTHQFLNALKHHMQSMDASQGQPHFGIVTSYNPKTHAAKVKVMPQDDSASPLVSGWLPICTPSLGNGWGLVAPPAIGEQVLIVCDSGDRNHGVILGSVFSKQSLPPDPDGSGGTQSSEFSLVHQSGSFLKFTNDGRVTLETHDALRVYSHSYVQLLADGMIQIQPVGGSDNIKLIAPTVEVTGNLTVTGDITAGQGTGNHIGLRTHKHGTGSAAAGTVVPTANT